MKSKAAIFSVSILGGMVISYVLFVLTHDEKQIGPLNENFEYDENGGNYYNFYVKKGQKID